MEKLRESKLPWVDDWEAENYNFSQFGSPQLQLFNIGQWPIAIRNCLRPAIIIAINVFG